MSIARAGPSARGASGLCRGTPRCRSAGRPYHEKTGDPQLWQVTGTSGNACLGRTQGQDGTDDLGNHVTGLVDDDGVPMRTSLRATNKQLCRVARETTEPSTVVGRTPATGRGAAGAPHLHGDVAQDGRLLLGRELKLWPSAARVR